MGLLGELFGGGSSAEQPIDEQRREFLGSPVGHQSVSSQVVDCDELPNAIGDFGCSSANPIPVNGPVGETIYLNLLRSRSGVGCFYHRIGSTQSPVSPHAVDMYEIVAIDASQSALLYFSMYHPRRSRHAPKGWSKRPWSSLNQVERVLCRLDCFGVRSACVENFPFGLPLVIEQSTSLTQVSPAFGKVMAERIRRILQEHPDRWRNYLQTRPAYQQSVGRN